MKVMLLGGPHDGQRTEVPDHLTEVLMPPPRPPPTVSEMLRKLAEYVYSGMAGETVLDKAALYRWTGSIQDDGTRVFTRVQ